ncbi:MAG TPA: lanthionine synthetase C family protein [Thermoanaerobaculia bacterium]|nr:lanthionine synthetase C family protein [Thermoanaerobaculia bacterium]
MTDASPTPPWRPLLTGELVEHAQRVLSDIASGLATTATGDSARDLSLAGGQAGIAMFFAYLNAAYPDQGHDDTAMSFLERAIEGTSELAVGAGLYSGFAGVAWALEHLQGRLFDPDGEDPGEEIATILQGYLGRTPWYGDYDLISGLVGFGVYGLERLPRAAGQACLEATVARLAETSEVRPEGGISWYTPADRVGPIQREAFPEGYYNLGVAHGVPGVVGLLGEVCAAGVAPAESRRLLDGAVEWILTQRLAEGAGSLYPYNFAVGIAPTATRLAWCYGDLGIATSLLAAARAVGEPAWEKEALTIARSCAARALDGSGVVDPGLCHGAAGAAHLFNRLYQATGEPSLGEVSRRWFEKTLTFQKTEGIGGFQAWLPKSNDIQGDLGWMDDAGFLTGSAGIGLALLAAISDVPPEWDRVLLTAIRPPQDNA